MKIACMIVLFFSFLAVALAQDDPPPLTVCRQAETPPVIDGKLDDPCWSETTEIGNFLLLGGALAREQTRVCVTYDRENLYVAFSCLESKAGEIRGSQKKHDGAMDADDSVELFLNTDVTGKAYYHLAANARGVQVDAKRNFDGVRKNADWNPKWRSVAGTLSSPSGWTVEMAIPFAEIGVKSPSEGTQWGVNFCRQEQPMGEISSWAPAERGFFHTPEKFGTMVFGGTGAPALQLAPLAGVAPGENRVEGFVRNNAGGSFNARFLVEADFDRFKAGGCKDLVFPGRKKMPLNIVYQVSGDLRDGVSYRWSCRLTDSTGEKVYYRSPRIPGIYHDWNGQIEQLKKQSADIREKLKKQGGFPPGVGEEMAVRLQRTMDSQNQLNARQGSQDGLEGKITQNRQELNALEKEIQGYEIFGGQVEKKRLDFYVGTAPGTESIFRHVDFNGRVAGDVEIFSAKNEFESFQLAVVPLNKKVGKFKVEISDLKDASGSKTIASAHIRVNQVGYVETVAPSYAVPYVGYWPDPLRPRKETLSLDSGARVLPVWITVYVPADAGTGDYAGEMTVQGIDSHPLRLKLNVHVWNFGLPKQKTVVTQFNTLASWSSVMGKGSADYLKHLPPQTHREICRFLIENYHMGPWNGSIQYSPIEQMYRGVPKNYLRRDKNGGFDFSTVGENLRSFIDAGLNRYFLMSFPIGVPGGYPEKFKNDVRDYLRQYAGFLKQKGLLDNGYIYLCDEAENENDYELIKESSRICREVAPGVKRVGVFDYRALDAPVKLKGFVDIWVPHMDIYEKGNFKQCQDRGEEVWFYSCNTTHPYPGYYSDYPSLDPRIIYWMCWKYNAKGFLCWAGNAWYRAGKPGNSRKDFDQDGPKASWKTSCNMKNGCSYVFYPALDEKGGLRPLGSVRAENIRDGVEDYEYFHILKERVEALKKAGAQDKRAAEVAEAEKLLAIPGHIVKALDDYTQNPADLHDYRRKVGDMIEKLGEVK
ncbi:MAG: DUF6067 family protein [Verrucomicrobiae bacterium]|nr:DUF6067 family protein [Verrucomicrobiae bacterium]